MKPNQFEKFLINRELLEVFKINMKNHYINLNTLESLLKYEKEINYVFKSFTWSDTPQNYSFWENVNVEWKECLKKRFIMKITKFEKFLYNRGLLEAFENNFKNGWHNIYTTNEYFESNIDQYELIKKAFSWINTPEGGKFWNNLDREWRESLNDNSL